MDMCADGLEDKVRSEAFIRRDLLRNSWAPPG